MSRVAVMTDSNSGITQSQAKELGITVVPMPFYIDGKLYYEDIDLTQEDFYRMLEKGGEISTSMPAVGDLIDRWETLLKDYDEIVYIPMSSGLSSSCATAKVLAQDYEGKVFVVDNQRISVTMKQTVFEAMKMAEHGKTAAEIRDILEADAVSVVVKETELKNVLGQFREKPKLVITDSQAFEKVAADTPEDILLTSFSILFARYKGDLAAVVKGVTALDTVEDGDVILISEGCTHHRQCDDIGTVKLPRWIREYTGKEIRIETTSGTEFPDELTKYKMIIHCGGCMLNEREMKYRLKCAEDQGVPMTNYGIAIAFMKGILKRSVEVFPEIYEML